MKKQASYSGQHFISELLSWKSHVYSVSVSSACYKEESLLKAVKVSHFCCNVTGSFFFLQSSSWVWEVSVQALESFFQWRKSLYSHNKNKSVLYFTIYFKYFHYEALISPTRSISIQHFQKTSVTGTLRKDNLYSHTSPLFQPRPRRTSRRCTRRSISASCCAAARSTARPSTRLYILVSKPSWSSGTQHTLAAFGSNLGLVPLDKRFLWETTFKIRDTVLRRGSKNAQRRKMLCYDMQLGLVF